MEIHFFELLYFLFDLFSFLTWIKDTDETRYFQVFNTFLNIVYKLLNNNLIKVLLKEEESHFNEDEDIFFWNTLFSFGPIFLIDIGSTEVITLKDE